MALEDEQLNVMPGVIIEFHKFNRGNKYGIWLMQGTIDNPTEFWIPEWEIDAHIAALNRAKAMIDNSRIE